MVGQGCGTLVTILIMESVKLENAKAVGGFCLVVAVMAELACPAIPQCSFLATAAE